MSNEEEVVRKIAKALEEDHVEIDFISHIPYKCTTTFDDGISDMGSAGSIIRTGDHSINGFNKNPTNISSDLMKKIKQSILDTIKNHK